MFLRPQFVKTSLCILAVVCFAMLFAPSTWAAQPSPRELLDSGRADEAIRVLTPLATGNNASAFNYLGRVYYQLKDWDNAVRNCERAAQIEPNNAEFQLWLGRAYGEKADSAGPVSAYSLARKSVAAFEAAHNLDRHSRPIIRDLGEYYSAAPSIVGGGSTRALAFAAEIAPEYPSDAAWIRAMVASSDGDKPLAEREYMESIRLSGGTAESYIELARYFRGHKYWSRYEQTLATALRSSQVHPDDRYDIAESLLRSGRNLQEAERQMTAYIQSGHPDEAAPLFRAHHLLGDILLKSGDTDRATAEYKAALALASTYRPAVDALRHLGR
jgi:tetratricopeptide (TPR) repeat protein